MNISHKIESETQDKPISIHIPPELQPLAVPLGHILHERRAYTSLAVGAFIFTPGENASSSRLLMVQRAASEQGFPNCWEVPGGSSEYEDPTILHSVAREVFEETGLRLTRFVRQIGKGLEFSTGPAQSRKLWLKLDFEIEVAEIGNALLSNLGSATTLEEESSTKVSNSIDVVLDSSEHQAYRWLREEEIRSAKVGEGSLPLIGEDQKEAILQAFELRKAHVHDFLTYLHGHGTDHVEHFH